MDLLREEGRPAVRRSLNGTRPQFSSDAWNGYHETMSALRRLGGLGASLTKENEGTSTGRGRYAPPRVSGVIKRVELGRPNGDGICAPASIERKNLTIRTMQRRFTRLAVAFSRKWANLRAACALHVGYYNFVWQHRSLDGLTPAMAPGVTPSPRSVADLVGGC